MNELWEYIVVKAETDPGYLAVLRLRRLNRASEEECLLALLKYQDGIRSTLMETVLKCKIMHMDPIPVIRP